MAWIELEPGVWGEPASPNPSSVVVISEVQAEITKIDNLIASGWLEDNLITEVTNDAIEVLFNFRGTTLEYYQNKKQELQDLLTEILG